MRLLAPDDAADLIQAAPADAREILLAELDARTHRDVTALLAYAEDVAGGLMNPRFARLRPEMPVDEAILYLRRQAGRAETIYYAYALDADQRLVGVVPFRSLFAASETQRVRDVMLTEFVAVSEEMDQEAVASLFAEYHVLALPVVDGEGRMKGIVTLDDIMAVVEAEASEDMALFIPLIISSGGNSGSQATTLVIRAMALGEVRLRDCWRVVRREVGAGLTLGAVLGAIGLGRILLWQAVAQPYGAHYLLVALTVAGSLLGVVLFGTLVGAMLPFMLRGLGLDPPAPRRRSSRRWWT